MKDSRGFSSNKANSKSMSSRRSALALVGVALLFASVTWIVRAYNQPVPSLSDSASASGGALVAPRLPPSSSSKPTQKPVRIETEIITVLPHGFEPAEITRPRGRFILMVDNRSGLEEVSLQLDREAGARLLAAQVHRSRPDWDDVFDLPPGNYILTEANHSEWGCRITITAQ